MRPLPQRAADGVRRLRAVAQQLNLEASTLDRPYSGSVRQEDADKAAQVAEDAAELLYLIASMLRGEKDV